MYTTIIVLNYWIQLELVKLVNFEDFGDFKVFLK